MKSKRLLFILFLVYWVVVYGVSFISNQQIKDFFKETIPTGYRMFVPMTKTNFDVQYKFYQKGMLIKEVALSDYLKKEYNKSLFNNKVAYIKDKLYFGSIKILDFKYQNSLYNEHYLGGENNFKKLIETDQELVDIIESLKVFPKLYLSENKDIISDSISISVNRFPIILDFDERYEGDFTYKAGEGEFYKAYIKLDK